MADFFPVSAIHPASVWPLRSPSPTRRVEAASTVRSCGALETEGQEQQRTAAVLTEQGHTTSIPPICRVRAAALSFGWPGRRACAQVDRAIV